MTHTHPLNFAIVGCGRVSPKHFEALTSNPMAKVVAVCDIVRDKAEAAAAKYGVPFFTDYHEMVKAVPGIDVINVLTPSGLHAKHVIDLSQYKRHIVVEKPIALTLEDAEGMIRACDQHGIRLFVVKQNRYNLPVQKLREAVEAGRFGKMVMGTARVRWCRTQAYYDQDSWRGTWEMDGGVIANQAVHHIDLLTWMMGDVESVFAYTATRLVKIEADDTAVAVLRFTNGALGIVEATTATRPKDLEGSISILGENGSVEIGGFAVNQMRVWNFKEMRASDSEVITHYHENPADVYGFGHGRFLAKVIEAIQEGKGGIVDGIEGMKSLVLINAMYESMETGREVKLRFRPSHARIGRNHDFVSSVTRSVA